MKISVTLLLALSLIACGGGGGGTTGGGNNGGNNLLQQAALAILGDCVADPVTTIGDIIGAVGAFPGAAAPPITIGDPDGNEIPFAADVGAPIPELLGVFSFRDDTGQAIMPFTAQDLQNDVNNLINGIAGLPNGTKVSVTVFAIPSRNVESASLTQTMQNGLPVDIGGFFRMVDATCSIDISFTGETILSLLGAYPNLTASIDLTSGEDVLDGSIFFNGTKTAVIEVSINGTGPFQFQLDLDTGVVTSTPGD
jgi:hypothetical protein